MASNPIRYADLKTLKTFSILSTCFLFPEMTYSLVVDHVTFNFYILEFNNRSAITFSLIVTCKFRGS